MTFNGLFKKIPQTWFLLYQVVSELLLDELDPAALLDTGLVGLYTIHIHHNTISQVYAPRALQCNTG
jgi:hypothetical protein